jgi:hypothetical protein
MQPSMPTTRVFSLGLLLHHHVYNLGPVTFTPSSSIQDLISQMDWDFHKQHNIHRELLLNSLQLHNQVPPTCHQLSPEEELKERRSKELQESFYAFWEPNLFFEYLEKPDK